jgi:hypothetical protein
MVTAAIVATALLSQRANGQVQTASSNVGYIDDAIIQTQLRLRFDAAYDADRPDRAEFFYAKCGCFRELAQAGLGGDPNAPGPAPPLNGGNPARTRFIETSVDYQDISLNLEYAFDRELSLFVEAPFRFLDPEINDNTGGLGDMQFGVKRSIWQNCADYLTFQFRTYVPTGDADRGLGTAHVSLEPALLYYGQLNDHLSLEAEFRDWIPISASTGAGTPFDGSFSGNILRYGIGLGYDLYNCQSTGQKLTPIVEVVGWTVLKGLASGSVDGTGATAFVEDVKGDTIVNLKLGLRTYFSPCDSFYAGWGHALTDEVWYENILRLEYRRTF